MRCLGKTGKMQKTFARWKFKRSEQSQNSPIRIASIFCFMHRLLVCPNARCIACDKANVCAAQSSTTRCRVSTQDNNDYDEHRIKASSNTLELLKSLLISCKYILHSIYNVKCAVLHLVKLMKNEKKNWRRKKLYSNKCAVCTPLHGVYRCIATTCSIHSSWASAEYKRQQDEERERDT